MIANYNADSGVLARPAKVPHYRRQPIAKQQQRDKRNDG
jgi:hypothetical protein